MKHLLFSGNNAWGMYNFRKAVFQHFLEAGWRVSVAAPFDATHFALLEALGCEVYPLQLNPKGTNPVHDIRLIREYVQLFQRLRPNLSITYTVKPNIYGSIAAKRTKTPYLPVTTGMGYTFMHNTPIAWITKQLYRIALRQAPRVWFLNEDDSRSFLRQGLIVPSQRYILNGEGIDLEEFGYAPPNDATAPTRILMIGRLLRDKGVMEYIEAARRIKERRPEVEFQLLGGLWQNNPTAIRPAQLKEWEREGVVTYLGAVSDVRPYIAQASCIVLPSYREGVSRTLLEGAAMGRPLIATDVPGCRDVVQEGENGFLCMPRSVESLAEAMERFLALSYEERIAMGERGRTLAQERFSIAHVLEAYDAIVSELAHL